MFEFEFTIGRTEPAPRMSFANAHLRIVDRFEPQCRRTRMPQKSGFSATGVRGINQIVAIVDAKRDLEVISYRSGDEPISRRPRPTMLRSGQDHTALSLCQRAIGRPDTPC